MKLRIPLSIVALGIALSAFSQNLNKPDPTANKRGCATAVPSQEWDVWFNARVEEYKQNQIAQKAPAANYVIPVIVHVIHGGQNVGVFPNISQTQVNSQISVLNADFAGSGLNVGQLAATAFSAVGAVNCNITFCLAQLDPNGVPLAEPGIDRINYTSKGWPNPTSQTTSNGFQSLMNATIKPGSIWNPVRYFNIWVTDVNQGTQLLGFATFPAGSTSPGLAGFGSAANDGIWVWSRAFGNMGAVSPPYHLGRTASHETGHWLGLRHIGGDGNGNPNGDCNASDYCNDTPPQLGGFSGGQYGQNFGSPTYPLHLGDCLGSPDGDMFMNFMDYVDDPACYMFTPDQNTRIQTAMVNGIYRKQLTASSSTMCNLPSVSASAAFTLADSTCIDTLLLLTNQSLGLPGPTYTWSSIPSGAVFSPSLSSPNPTLSFSIPGTYTITLVAKNSLSTSTISKSIEVIDCGNLAGVSKNSLRGDAIKIMPNPSSGILTLLLKTTSSGNSVIEVSNSLGQSVYTSQYRAVGPEGMELNLSRLPKGVYTLTIQSGSEKAVKKLVIQ